MSRDTVPWGQLCRTEGPVGTACQCFKNQLWEWERVNTRAPSEVAQGPQAWERFWERLEEIGRQRLTVEGQKPGLPGSSIGGIRPHWELHIDFFFFETVFIDCLYTCTIIYWSRVGFYFLVKTTEYPPYPPPRIPPPPASDAYIQLSDGTGKITNPQKYYRSGLLKCWMVIWHYVRSLKKFSPFGSDSVSRNPT